MEQAKERLREVLKTARLTDVNIDRIKRVLADLDKLGDQRQ